MGTVGPVIRPHPTVILIGGPMTVDDGSTIDSRQPVEGDPESRVTRKSMATSWLWWTTASSVVGPLLDAAGDHAFALLIGDRSVVELRSDGNLRRTGLRSLLAGGTSVIELVRTSMDEPLVDGYEAVATLRGVDDQSLGTIGVRIVHPARRWRFLNGNDYYLSYAGPLIRPTVIVDTSDLVIGGEFPNDTRFQALDELRLFNDDVVLVVPHTERAESLLRDYFEWIRAGRPPTPTAPSLMPAGWDPSTPPDPVRYASSVPVEADFRVTGLIEGGEWRDSADFEAARALLQSRFDLRIGIWDLVRNPVLRRTLLDAAAVPPTPSGAAPIPVGAAGRADRRVAQKLDDDATEAAALRAAARQLRPLKAVGWKATSARPGEFRLALTEPLRRWPMDEPCPLVELMVAIARRQTTVSLWTCMYNDIDVHSYVVAHRETLERIAAPDLCDFDDERLTVWRSAGGWADDVEWAVRGAVLADRTGPWAEAFADLCADCVQVQRQRFAAWLD